MKLDQRRKIEVELPEFLIRSLLHRVAETNAADDREEDIELNDIIEWYLASPITIADVPRFEAVIPGFSDALGAWLNSVTFDPQ